MNASAEASSPWAFTRRVLIAVVIVGTVIMLSEAVEAAARMFLVLFAGILFGVFLNGLARLLAGGTGLSYGWSLGIVVVLLLALVVGLGWYMLPQISSQIDQFMQQSGQAYDRMMQQLRQTQWGQWLANQLQGMINEQSSGGQQGSAAGNSSLTLSQVGSWARQIVQGVLFYFAAVAIIFFVGLYLATDPERYRGGAVKLVPISRRERARTVLNTLGDTLWHWLIGRIAAMLIIAIATVVGLWLMGIPLPVTLGVIAGLLTFIPNLGPILALIPQVMLAYQVGTQMVLYVIIFNLVLQTVESYLITPLIQQHQVELPAGMIIAVQVVLGMLVGWLGLLLATPLAAATMVLIQMLYIEDILGDPSVAPEASAG